ncbi:MAG: hypothetical protein Q4D51_07110 [Eubacteriales bacterium]|nr:hypothetical protein [Eubacteriales bacterium]
MDLGRKILLLLGCLFTGIGIVIELPILASAIIVGMFQGARYGWTVFASSLIGLIFPCIGIILLATVVPSYMREKKARELGTRYPAKYIVMWRTKVSL